jgi:FtsH-binding integral membrane protein
MDLESGKLIDTKREEFVKEGEVPVQTIIEQSVRVGFIRKVYGILSCQLLLTVLVAGTCMKVDSVRNFVVTNPWMLTLAMVMSIGLIVGLMVKKDEHPTNMYLLTAFTFVESYTIGVICASFEANGMGSIVLQAAILTLVVFISLTAFTMQSKFDFSFLGGALYSGLMILITWSFMGFLFGFPQGALFSLGGALLFCGFILYDTHMILERLGPDDYIVASIELYLDIINLFIYILDLLSRDNR